MQFPTSVSPLPLPISGDVIGDYFDSISGRQIIVATPAAQPDLWASYIDGAQESYRQHHVESAIEYDSVRDGHSTALFFAILESDGRVIGGLRVQGPLAHPDQAHAVREWAGRPGTDEIRDQISQRLLDGVVEVKAVWVDHDAPRHHAMTSAMARAFIHTMDLLHVRHALCTAAGHAVTRWQSSGGVVSATVPPVPYPDDRYRTRLMWWDRQQVARLLGDDQVGALLSESAQLFRQPAATSATLPSVA